VDGDPRDGGYVSAVRCDRCGTSIALDIGAVRFWRGDPVFWCTRCRALVPVPVFDDGAGGVDARVHDEVDAPGAAARVTAATCDPPQERFVQAADTAFEERRRDGRPERGVIRCRACGGDLRLEPERMRLTWTHAVIACPGCGAEIAARRADAYRGVVDALSWGFAAYAGAADERGAPEPKATSPELRVAPTRPRRRRSRLSSRERALGMSGRAPAAETREQLGSRVPSFVIPARRSSRGGGR
jgi:hypothetical protein